MKRTNGKRRACSNWLALIYTHTDDDDPIRDICHTSSMNDVPGFQRQFLRIDRQGSKVFCLLQLEGLSMKIAAEEKCPISQGHQGSHQMAMADLLVCVFASLKMVLVCCD